MLQRALIKSDKTVLLQKNCYRNGLIIFIVVHEKCRQKKYGLSINDLLSFILGLLQSLKQKNSLKQRVRGLQDFVNCAVKDDNVTSACQINFNYQCIYLSNESNSIPFF